MMDSQRPNPRGSDWDRQERNTVNKTLAEGERGDGDLKLPRRTEEARPCGLWDGKAGQGCQGETFPPLPRLDDPDRRHLFAVGEGGEPTQPVRQGHRRVFGRGGENRPGSGAGVLSRDDRLPSPNPQRKLRCCLGRLEVAPKLGARRQHLYGLWLLRHQGRRDIPRKSRGSPPPL